MANLTAKSACEGLLPITAGPFALAEAAPAHITSIAPFVGKTKAASDALRKAHGTALPEANRATSAKGAQTVWTGQGQSFLIGPAPASALAATAALTDQSDAWAMVELTGDGPEEVLARLTPLDLHPAVFSEDHAARSLIGHMTTILFRIEGGFTVMVFRSMAHTLIHELHEAMKSVAAERALTA